MNALIIFWENARIDFQKIELYSLYIKNKKQKQTARFRGSAGKVQHGQTDRCASAKARLSRSLRPAYGEEGGREDQFDGGLLVDFFKQSPADARRLSQQKGPERFTYRKKRRVRAEPCRS